MTTKAFYSEYRRSLTHPSCAESDFVLPTTLAEWKSNKSRKVDALIQILQHHLKEDDAIPLSAENGELVVDNTLLRVKNGPGTQRAPDKIVVYCEYPSIFPFLQRVGSLFFVSKCF